MASSEDVKARYAATGWHVTSCDGHDYADIRRALAEAAHAAYDDLAARYDVIIAEGAGSPTEINLRAGDYVNLGLARHAGLPTVVVCFNDLVAIGALNAARAAGLRVPEDVSITGWDDLPMASWEIVQLTTVSQSMHEMARTAARLTVERVEGVAGPDPRHVLFAPKLVMRSTLGPPRAT